MTIAAFGLFLATIFQNCSKVDLAKEASVEQPILAFGTGSLCLGTQKIDASSQLHFDGYTVTHFYVANLNLMHKQGELVIDSDSDGLSDDDEKIYGFNPVQRRSTSKMLDSICLDLAGTSNCLSQQPVCTGAETVFGLNDCDTKVLNLDKIGSHLVAGLDSDKDGMIDLLEILRRTDPAHADALNDPDRDGFLNAEELQTGSDPLQFNAMIDADKATRATFRLSQNMEMCAGEEWKLTVKQIPFVQMPAFSDTNVKSGLSTLDFSHDKDENLAIVVVRIQPKPGYSGNPKYLYQSLKISKLSLVFNLKSSAFLEAGEVLP